MICFNDSTKYRVQENTGFFVASEEGGIKSCSQFQLHNAVPHDSYVSILSSPVSHHEFSASARFVLVHQDLADKNQVQTIGFSSHKQSKDEYFYIGRMPAGIMYIVPITGNVYLETKKKRRWSDIVKCKHGCVTFTEAADEALGEMFLLLDSNRNYFVSRAELSTLKHLLGYEGQITEDEWDDALYGWSEGDVSEMHSEISLNLFKNFISRLLTNEFSFNGKSDSIDKVKQKYKSSLCRTKACAQLLFQSMGFDRHLCLTRASRYIVRVCSLSGPSSTLSRLPHTFNHVPGEKALLSATGVFGVRLQNLRSNIEIFYFLASDWFSLSVLNNNNEHFEITVDCTESKGATSQYPAFIQKIKLLPRSEKLALVLFKDRHSEELFQIQSVVVFRNPEQQLKRIRIL